MATTTIPEKQRAVQLVGPDELRINNQKEVFVPGPHQVLGKVEVVGLCFSDLKLLKQFDGHVRKSAVASGIDQAILGEMPHYVPGKKATVPGHETVVRIVKVGAGVTKYRIGERYLVQTDYRYLPTANSASAFGYNFEGALQEYVLIDERIVTAPDGESMLIPVPEDLPASALALCEPWACVEDAYVEKQRRTLKPGGKCLVVGDGPVDAKNAVRCKPDALPTGKQFDDVIYFGSDAAMVEKLFANVATNGLLIIVQGGGKFGRSVLTAVGRVHYGGIRIIGTAGGNVADALAVIPATAEIRTGDKINVVGAAGPMGTMHVIRDLCQGVAGVTVFAGDLNDDRLRSLERLAQPLAEKNRVRLQTYNPSKAKLNEKFDYFVLMAPIPALAAQAVKDAAPKAIINIFAGIPADKTGEINLDAYIEKQCYFIGTSGSTIDDMKKVLEKVKSGTLDTNLSVAAISGLDGAIDGIRAVEKNLMPGKIIVYPSAKGLKLTPLTDLKDLPLEDGRWTGKSEQALHKKYSQTA